MPTCLCRPGHIVCTMYMLSWILKKAFNNSWMQLQMILKFGSFVVLLAIDRHAYVINAGISFGIISGKKNQE